MLRVMLFSIALVVPCTLLPGCSEHNKSTTKTEISTPGGTTTITTEKDVKKTGDHKDK